jgi:hypothetical protein
VIGRCAPSFHLEIDMVAPADVAKRTEPLDIDTIEARAQAYRDAYYASDNGAEVAKIGMDIADDVDTLVAEVKKLRERGPTLAGATVEQLRAELARRVHDDPDADHLKPLGQGKGSEECVTGRFWGIFDSEGFNEPAVLFASKEDAEAYMAECQALDSDDDRWLSQDHCICRVDAIYSTWNSSEPDPYEPLPSHGSPPYTIRVASDVVKGRG